MSSFISSSGSSGSKLSLATVTSFAAFVVGKRRELCPRSSYHSAGSAAQELVVVTSRPSPADEAMNSDLKLFVDGLTLADSEGRAILGSEFLKVLVCAPCDSGRLQIEKVLSLDGNSESASESSEGPRFLDKTIKGHVVAYLHLSDSFSPA